MPLILQRVQAGAAGDADRLLHRGGGGGRADHKRQDAARIPRRGLEVRAAPLLGLVAGASARP